MITEQIKRFTVILSYLDGRTKKDVLENLSALSSHVDQYPYTANSQNKEDFNAVFATKLFERIYGHRYYFPQERADIQKSHIRDQRRMIIITSAIRDFTKATKEERTSVINDLTVVPKMTRLERFMNIFSNRNR